MHGARDFEQMKYWAQRQMRGVEHDHGQDFQQPRRSNEALASNRMSRRSRLCDDAISDRVLPRLRGCVSKQLHSAIREKPTIRLGGGKKMAASIALVHGADADGSCWSKVIPILKDAGHSLVDVPM